MRSAYSLTLASLLALTSSAGAGTYSIRDLGTLGGATSQAMAVNDSGQVAGTAKTATGRDHAFFFDGQIMRDLGTLLGADADSFGNAINNTGQVAGTSATRSPPPFRTAFLYDGNSMIDVGIVFQSSVGTGINAAGKVVGTTYKYDVPDSSAYPFQYNGTASGHVARLGGSDGAELFDINDVGQYVGRSRTFGIDFPNGVTHIMRGASDLGALPGSSYASGSAINNLGQVTGFSTLVGVNHAVFYNGTNLIDIGSLPGDQQSVGRAINDSGEIVGMTERAPFLYRSGQMVNLALLVTNSAGWQFTDVTGISNTGFISGTGTINGQQHGFLLTPVPEPGALFLSTIGAFILWAHRFCPKSNRTSWRRSAIK